MTSAQLTFGTVLVAAVATAKLSTRQFAIRVGVDQANLQAIIAGRRKPKLDTLEPWADALGLAGPDRAAFLEAGWLALSPPQVASLVADLRAQVRDRARRGQKATGRRRRA